MPFVEFTALLALATAMSFTPGPNTTLSTALAANRGLACRGVGCASAWIGRSAAGQRRSQRHGRKNQCRAGRLRQRKSHGVLLGQEEIGCNVRQPAP